MRRYICTFGQHLWPPFKSVPQQIYFDVLFVLRRLSPIAERVLYNRSNFLFSPAESFQGFVGHVIQRIRLG